MKSQKNFLNTDNILHINTYEITMKAYGEIKRNINQINGEQLNKNKFFILIDF